MHICLWFIKCGLVQSSKFLKFQRCPKWHSKRRKVQISPAGEKKQFGQMFTKHGKKWLNCFSQISSRSCVQKGFLRRKLEVGFQGHTSFLDLGPLTSMLALLCDEMHLWCKACQGSSPNPASGQTPNCTTAAPLFNHHPHNLRVPTAPLVTRALASWAPLIE